MNYRSVIRSVRRRPDIYFGPGALTYDQLAAFILGLDIGAEGAVLDGFREFLIDRVGPVRTAAPGWSGLVLCFAFADGRKPAVRSDADRRAVACLFDLVEEFLAGADRPAGTARTCTMLDVRPPHRRR